MKKDLSHADLMKSDQNLYTFGYCWFYLQISKICRVLVGTTELEQVYFSLPHMHIQYNTRHCWQIANLFIHCFSYHSTFYY